MWVYFVAVIPVLVVSHIYIYYVGETNGYLTRISEEIEEVIEETI